MAGAVFLIAALGVENKLCRNRMKLASRNKKQTRTGAGASVSITITIDIGRPRAVVRQRIEGVSKHPETGPRTWSDVSFKGNLSRLYRISSVKP